MLESLRSPFGEVRSSYTISSRASMVVGLKILVQVSPEKSSIVVTKPASSSTRMPDRSESCFLKHCHLCNKTLSLDKEVYMYRGDLGFCSVDCRNRQIVLDEMKELETSTKQMVAPFRHCGSAGRRETQILQHHLHERRRLPIQPKRRPIFT